MPLYNDNHPEPTRVEDYITLELSRTIQGCTWTIRISGTKGQEEEITQRIRNLDAILRNTLSDGELPTSPVEIKTKNHEGA